MVENKINFEEKDTLVSLPEATATPITDATARGEDVDPIPVSDEGISNKNVMVASGVTGAVLGFFVGGPIGSALLGFTAAYASKKDGPPGDAARALGNVGCTVREKAIEVDQKHKIVEKSTEKAALVWEGAKKYDQKNILEYSRGLLVHSWNSFVGFVNERRLLQKGVDTAGRGYEYVAEKVRGQDTINDTRTPEQNDAQAHTATAERKS